MPRNYDDHYTQVRCKW